MTRKNPDSIHVFTARMPVDEYEAVQAFAFFNEVSINELVVKAIRSYLSERASDTELDAMIEGRRERMRTAIDRMGED